MTISPNIVLMTKDELAERESKAFQRGVDRGKFEAGSPQPIGGISDEAAADRQLDDYGYLDAIDAMLRLFASSSKNADHRLRMLRQVTFADQIICPSEEVMEQIVELMREMKIDGSVRVFDTRSQNVNDLGRIYGKTYFDYSWILANMMRFADEARSGLSYAERLLSALDCGDDEIMAERRRQISVEGWAPDHDDHHTDGSLLQAATAYYYHATGPEFVARRGDVPVMWPWDAVWWKPKNPHRDLVRAGALCLAERERLQRANHEADLGQVNYWLDHIIKALERLRAAS